MEAVYNFNRVGLVDLAEGLPKLDENSSVAVYRQMRYTFKDRFLGKSVRIGL